MDGLSRRKHTSRGENQSHRVSWCCSFTVPPSSPENLSLPHSKALRNKSDTLTKLSNSVTNSPQSSKSGLSLVGRIDPRRILSPGRVSPIDPDHDHDHPAVDSIPEVGPDPSATFESMSHLRTESFKDPIRSFRAPEILSGSSSSPGGNVKDGFDVRLNLRGKNGRFLVLEMNSEALSANSKVFASLIGEHKKGFVSISGSSGSKICRIEVPEVENLGVFKETIELMFEENITSRLSKIGVYRAIDILEISASIMFTRGVVSCLKYLEAVPWTEEQEQKLRNLFTKFNFDDSTSKDILARLYMLDSVDSQQNLARQLVWSITTCADTNARNELKSLIKGLLCKSSIYEKDHSDLNKEDLYAVCQSCVNSLVTLFEEASGASLPERPAKEFAFAKPLIERISMQVDNINWLLEILLDRQMAEEFVDIWAAQGELIKMHGDASPMVRYELSRVSAILFIAMGTRKLHCRSDSRLGVLQAWFSPMLSDFGWLQRCRKGLDMKALEEAMGQTLLTLPLKQQYTLFMEWFRCFSKHGTECPNLCKPFQIWWRRSFLRGSETSAIESR